MAKANITNVSFKVQGSADDTTEAHGLTRDQHDALLDGLKALGATDVQLSIQSSEDVEADPEGEPDE